jgi:hypothetical protein
MCGGFTAKDISVLLHALALREENFRDDETLAAVLARCETIAHGLDSRDLCVSLRSVATMGRGELLSPGLTAAMQRRALPLVLSDDFGAQDVSMLLSAAATLELRLDPELLAALQRRAEALSDELDQQARPVRHREPMPLHAAAARRVETEREE